MERPYCNPCHRHLKSVTYRTFIQILSACYDHSQCSASWQSKPDPDVCQLGILVTPDSSVAVEKEKMMNGSVEATAGDGVAVEKEKMMNGSVEATAGDGVAVEKEKMMNGSVEAAAEDGVAVEKEKMMNGSVEATAGDGVAVEKEKMMNGSVEAAAEDGVAVEKEKMMNGRVEATAGDGVAVEKEKIMNGSVNATAGDTEVWDSRITINEILDMMQIEEDGDLSKHEGLWLADSKDVTGFQDSGDCHQMLIDELEHIMNGDSQVVEGNTDRLAAPIVCERESGVPRNFNNRGESLEFQYRSIEGCGNEANLERDKEPCISNIDLRPIENIEDRSAVTSSEHEMQQKEMEPQKVDNKSQSGPENCMTKDIEVEEGEISGEFAVDVAMMDVLVDDSLGSERKKVGEKQVSDIIDKQQLVSNDQNRVDEGINELTSFVMDVGGANLDESVGREMQFKAKNIGTQAFVRVESNLYERNQKRKIGDNEDVVYSSNPPVTGTISEEGAIQKQGTAPKEKQDSDVGNKKKRGGCSAEKKAKKKQKERKRRAEKNRLLGVKRLKLRTVVKPKPVEHCRHYLLGRCQEGDNCKFSHDTVPLTKSKPCCHFARNSCMKGDDCPFDHELSKYPCNNFMVSGICNRGDSCMFSHKVPPKEDAISAPTDAKDDHRSPLVLSVSNSQKQILGSTSCQRADISSSRQVSSSKLKEHNITEAAVAPKGINCLFKGKSSVPQSSNITEKGNSSGNRNTGANVRNQSGPSSSSFQDMNETTKRTPVAVKGVNFLSFGRAPVDHSSGKKSSSLFWDGKDCSTPVGNIVNGHRPASLFNDGETSAKIGNKATEIVARSIQMSNETVRKDTQPGLSSSFNKQASMAESISEKNYCLPSSVGNGTKTTLQDSSTPLIKHQNSTTIPWKVLGSPLTSGKAVECTLATASKLNASAATNESRNTSGSSSIGSRGVSINESTRTAKILEFLSGFGNKARQ